MAQYKTERDGIVETRVEQKITIQSDGDPIDHDKALAEAIQVRTRVVISAVYIVLIFLSVSLSLAGGDGHESGHDS